MKTFKEWVKLEEKKQPNGDLIIKKEKSVFPIKSPINDMRVQILSKLVPPQDSSSNQ